MPSTSDPGRITQAQIKTLLETGKKEGESGVHLRDLWREKKTMEEMTTDQFKGVHVRFQGLPDQE